MRNLLAGLVLLPLAACGGRLAPADARQGFTALSTSLIGASAGAQASAYGASSSALTGGGSGNSTASSKIDFNASCLGGGSVHLAGTLNTASSGPDTFDYSATFANCSNEGVVIDGSLTFKLVANVSQGAAAVTWNYNGDVTFSGKVNGDCPMALTGSDSGSSAGVALNYSGTVCGQPSSAVFTAAY